jgi:hypothetical protein
VGLDKIYFAGEDQKAIFHNRLSETYSDPASNEIVINSVNFTYNTDKYATTSGSDANSNIVGCSCQYFYE